MKLLIWAVIIFLAMAWLMRGKKTSSQAGAGHGGRPARHAGRPEAMLPCRRCGLHVPASEAVKHASGAVFCCEEHRHQTFPEA